jgi:hypothetical protein
LTPSRGRAKPHDADVQLAFDRFIGEDDTLDVLQQTLTTAAPEWTRSLHVHEGPRERTAVDLSEEGALREAVMAAATRRGATYQQLVARHGAVNPRRQGSAEVRGSSTALTVVVSVDEKPLARMGDRLLLGNSITLQLRRAKIEGRAAGEWAAAVFERLCERTRPVWGGVVALNEYDAKVMSDGPGLAAIGRDFSRFLPGLFAVNFFGRRYRGLIADRGVREMEQVRTSDIGDGLLVELSRDPRDWEEPERRALERRVLEALGSDLFFSKISPDAPTRAPDWD